MCGDVPGLLDAHGICRPYSALPGQSKRVLLRRGFKVIIRSIVHLGYFYLIHARSRLATELGLDRDSNVKPLDERHERELLNRRRTWMICSIIDGSTSLETGKSPGVGKNDEVSIDSYWSHNNQVLILPPVALIKRVPLVLGVEVPAPIRCGSASDY